MMQISLMDLMEKLDGKLKGEGGVFVGLTIQTELQPGDGLNKKNRVTKEPCPYTEGVDHFSRRTVFMGRDYKKMVDSQRKREADAIIGDIVPDLPFWMKVEPVIDDFIPESLFRGKGRRHDRFPRFMAVHSETGQEYVVYALLVDNTTLLPIKAHESRYVDRATGQEIDVKDLKDYLPPDSKKPKAQGTDKPIYWRTVKVQNVKRVSLKLDNESEWDIIPPCPEPAGA